MGDNLFMELFDEATFLDIHTAASIGCEETVRDIIENSESKDVLDKRNQKGWTPLMYAACCANIKVVLLLIEEGANLNLKSDDGLTTLILAAKCGSSDVINVLIDNGAKINDKDLRGWTALFHAVIFGHRSVVQLLIERGAAFDAMDNKRITPLMLAAAAGHERIVHDLLQLGVNVEAECVTGDTARSLAIKNGCINVKNSIDAHKKKRMNDAPNIQHADLSSLLRELQLTKYYPIFEKEHIDIDAFWLLTDDDLKDIGIKLLGPRKKMCVAISQYHKAFSQKCGTEETDISKQMKENKKLLHLMEKLKATYISERNLRIATEQKLRNYKENASAAMNQVHTNLEQLKESHEFLKSLVCIVLSDRNLSNGIKSSIESIFRSIDCNQELIDIHYQKLISIQEAFLKI